MDRLENERLAMQFRFGSFAALIFPGEDIGEIPVVAQSFTLRCLMFLAEMSAARFIAGERVAAHQFAELEEIGDATSALE